MQRIQKILPILIFFFAFSACEQLNARRELQKGDQFYGTEKYSKAADHYEKSLEIASDGDSALVAHINAASAYAEIVAEEPRPVGPKEPEKPEEVAEPAEDATPEARTAYEEAMKVYDKELQKYDQKVIDYKNDLERYNRKMERYVRTVEQMRNKQIGHLEGWLALAKSNKSHCLGEDTPEETKLKLLEDGKEIPQICVKRQEVMLWLTSLWESTEQYDKAIAYWEETLQKEPNNRDAVRNIAVYYQGQGKFKESVDLMAREAKLVPDLEERSDIYESMVQVVHHEWRDMKWGEAQKLVDQVVTIVDAARLEAGDSPVLTEQMQKLMYYRGLLAGGAWAQAIEVGAQRDFQKKAAQLREKMEKAGSEAEPRSAATDGKNVKKGNTDV